MSLLLIATDGTETGATAANKINNAIAATANNTQQISTNKLDIISLNDRTSTFNDTINDLAVRTNTTEKNLSNINTRLSDYYNKTQTYSKVEVDTKIADIPTTDLSDYYKIAETYSKVEVDTKIADIPTIDLSGYYKKTETYSKVEVDTKIANIPTTDLTNYYKKSETYSKVETGSLVNTKQDNLVSGTNIKTINGQSVLGSGDIVISSGGGGGAVDSVAGKTGVVTLVKGDVGLNNVDNTSDTNKPISTATQTALNSKVDKVDGKGLSTEDYTTAEKTKLTGLSNYTKPASEPISYITGLQTALDSKVSKTGVETLHSTDALRISGTTLSLYKGDGTFESVVTQDTVYTLPNASETVLGGIKVGTNLSIDANGVLSANDTNVSFTEISNKPTNLSGYGITDAYTKTQVDSLIPNISTKQDVLVSGTNIKTINGQSVLGSGNIVLIDEVAVQSNTDYYQGAYGISWDYATDTYIRTGAKGYTSIQSKMRRCVLNTNGTVKYYLHKDNSNFNENGTPSILTGADGNVMVEIPKHYIKTETVGNVDSMSISLTPEPGYVLDPAFLKWNGTAMVEVPYRYFRAYEGFVSNGKLLSISGVTPTRSQNIATFRTQAMANGTGWHLTDWNLLNTIKRLCYIEFCDFIVTKYLGNGNDTGNDYGITTGQSNALGNRSSNSTHNDKYMSYRGIENLYADIWEFVDGVNVNNYQFYVNGKYSTFQSDIFTGDYVLKGSTTGAASNSLIKRCAASANMGFIPTVFGGSTTTFYGDAFWSSTGARIVFYSGSANNGASGGPGALNVNNASSFSDTNIGAAVCI